MRARTKLLVLVLTAVPVVAVAQRSRSHQFEFGAFGSFTRYDHVYSLDNQFGGGGRLGYFFSPNFGFEFDVGYQQPTPTTGGANAAVALGGGSLILNFGNDQNLFYISGGFARLAWGDHPSYSFTDNGVSSAIGDRIFFGERTALRLEGRAIYAPTTGFTGGEWAGHIILSAGLSLFAGPSHTFKDADRDGVADKKDACGATPAGAVVDTRGCPTDSDGDKVYSGLDACPNTVAGAEVDARGCPTDADADGVYDGIDKCPATPAGAEIDAQGCPTDLDGDGVPTGLDKCPNTPPGVEVDTAGCQRVSDSDRDGVDDTKDKCPGTGVDVRVDSAGCPILFTEARQPIVLRGVTFETGRSALKPDSYTILDLVATSLINNPDINIEIAGHTDSTGARSTNMRLSQSRADAVRAYLASKGVAPERMVAKGYGPTQPVASNASSDGRAQNRRVELRRTN